MTSTERTQQWRKDNPELYAAQLEMQSRRGKNEAVRRRSLKSASWKAGGMPQRLNNQIRELYQRGKTPADIVIRLHIPMSRVMAAIQNA